MFDVYLSSTVTNGNWDINERLSSHFEKAGFKTFIPQKDVDQGSTPKEMCRLDYEAMVNSKIIVAIFKNATRNFYIELGFAHGIKSKIIAVYEPDDPRDVMAETIDMIKIETDDTFNDNNYIDQLISEVKKVVSL